MRMLQRMKTNRNRQIQLGKMFAVESGDKVRFTYNDSPREGFIDFIWKWDNFLSGCYMTINFVDGMEDVEDSSFKNFSLNQVEDFEILEQGE